MSRSPKPPAPYDRALDALPPARRWREWMARVEAVIFAAPDPVPLAVLRPLVGDACRLDELIADIRAELAARPYDLVFVAGGWHHRTRSRVAEAIRAAGSIQVPAGPALVSAEYAILAAIAYHQPLTRAELARRLGIAVSRDSVARLKQLDLIGAGPRAPEPGAPLTYVTTRTFLSVFGLASLRELPDPEALADAGRHEHLPRALAGHDARDAESGPGSGADDRDATGDPA